MNVRSAILERLSARQMSLDELLKLDYLDRLITRTLNRMVRHQRIEEYEGVYALPGMLVRADIVTHAITIDLPEPVVVEKSFEEEVEKVFEIIEEVKDDSMALLDNTVKHIVAILPTLELADITALKDAELAGKARKSLLTVMKRFGG